MRLKLPELMADKGLGTAYALERFSKGVLPITTATRLVNAGGKPKRVDMETLDALCLVFGIRDMNDLLERDPIPSATSPKKPARRKRSA